MMRLLLAKVWALRALVRFTADRESKRPSPLGLRTGARLAADRALKRESTLGLRAVLRVTASRGCEATLRRNAACEEKCREALERA